MPLIELPFGLPGRIFAGQMPFSQYDPEGENLRQSREAGISTVVLLASDQECIEQTGKDLRALYYGQGWQVIYLPIPDFGVPPPEPLQAALSSTLDNARRRVNIIIHCHAGQGRTGMFVACLAHEVLGLSGEQAIGWMRSRIQNAIETRDQHAVVLEYAKKNQG